MNIISDTMEKYCKSCGRVFKNSDFKICPYCGNQLSTRTGRQPIPHKLRHQVFQRDGYRCRECGASKDETSLEIDHIVPVAKGGTNDINNLQTLCRECNRMKHTDEWVGGETDLESIDYQLKILKQQLSDAENGLRNAYDEDEKINYQFKIIKLNEAISKCYVEVEENKAYLIEKEKKDKLFKKIYVQLDDESLAFLSQYYHIHYIDKDTFIRSLVEEYTESDISKALSKKDEIKRKQEYLKNKAIIDKEEHEHKMEEKQGLKNCPYCGKQILSNAIRCKYCRRQLKQYQQYKQYKKKKGFISKLFGR